MNHDARKIEDDIVVLEQKLRALKSQLGQIRGLCQHRWGQVTYDPIVREVYQDPSDLSYEKLRRKLGKPVCIPVVLASPPFVERWKRACQECGLVEYTSSTEERIQRIPKFGR